MFPVASPAQSMAILAAMRGIAALPPVAQSAQGALDPEEFWHAWARGERTRIDLFGHGWDFWEWAPQPIADLRAKYIDVE